MKFNSIRAGNTFYTVSRQRMGNTTMSTVAVHEVTVRSTDSVHETVLASWNGNPARVYSSREFAKWRLNKPLLIKSGIGHRLATRKEIAAAKSDPSKR